MRQLAQSPTEKIHFRGHTFFVKREDLLAPAFSGNKARKFYYLLESDPAALQKIIGYGSAQANSLYSLSALAKLKNWQLDYYVDHIPRYLRENPRGNYRAALENGARIISVEGKKAGITDIESHIHSTVLPDENPKNTLFIPEGGRCELAEPGIKLLAEEILAWADSEGIDAPYIMLPSGTGTTALYLQKHLPFTVLTCACVGGDNYLKKQFQSLACDSRHHPTILGTKKKYHFGKLYAEFLSIWQALKEEAGIEFELLYDPLGWLTLLEHIDHNRASARHYLYIHQGGILGNETMLTRYLRKQRQQNDSDRR